MTRYGIFAAPGGVFTPFSANDRPIGSSVFDYPTTNGPLTYGWLGGTVSAWGEHTGWASGDDPRLQHFLTILNDGDPVTIRVDLPDGPGQYDLWILGALRSFSNGRIRVFDGNNATPLIDISETEELNGEPIDSVFVPTGPSTYTVVPFSANMAAAVSPVRVTVASDFLLVQIGQHAANSFQSALHGLWFQRVVAGPSIGGISPSVGRASGTVVDITVSDSSGCTGAAINGVPLTGFTIVNATTVRGTTNGATTGAVSVTNASGTGTGPTFTVVPVFNQIRFVGGGNPPWHPAADPVTGTPYSITLEAWNSTVGARDTLASGNVTLTPELVAAPGTTIGGDVNEPWSAGLVTFNPITFDDAVIPPEPPPTFTAVQRIPVFTTQPVVAAAGAGTAFSTQPVVTVRDAAGATLTSYTGLVVLRARGSTGLVLQGATAINAVAGVATFTGVVPILIEGGQFRGVLEAVLPTGETANSASIQVLGPNQPAFQRTVTQRVASWVRSVGFQLGPGITGNLFFEATVDGTNWVALSVRPVGGAAAVTQTNAAGAWVLDNVAGLASVRMRMDAAATGTPAITISPDD